ncbi:unnamed protein product [Adineta steineri]|uniref:Uncharacterized protein n=1 Tax=Adineta steineri TaxID=433720 RepID=A0A815IDA5_9BILA|nr:unnamed protein product [Adineta steineri]CAF1362210.1 unnamed protein product [Adineta steineri]
MMRAQGQTEQSDEPLVPLTSPPPVLQEPVEEQQPPQEQLPVEKCVICQEDIGPDVARIACRTCDSVYHQNELLDMAIQLNNEEQPLDCCVCDGDMSWVLELVTAPPSPDHLGIQPTELNIHIDNFN